MKKLNITIHKCFCGKDVEDYYKYIKVRKEIKNKKGKSYKIKRFHLVKVLKHFGYPETYCHCRACGKKWGEH